MKSPSPTIQGKQTGQVMLHHLLDQVVLSELDCRHWVFVKALPPRLAQLATDQRTVTGKGPSSRLQTVAEIGLTLGIPWAFRDTFPLLKEEQLLDVGEAWTFLATASFLRDHIADGQVPTSPDAEDLLEELMTKARSVFHSSVGNQPTFWQRFEQYEQQVVSALRSEADYRVSPSETYDLEAAWQIGIGKWALYKAPICAMAILCREMSSFQKLERSMDALAAGRQLYDDVVDWQEDLARGRYTYPLIQAMIHLKESEMPISPQTIEVEISDSTIREDALRQARAWHQESLSAVEGIPCQNWIDLVKNSMADCISEHCRLILCRIAEAAKEKRHTV